MDQVGQHPCIDCLGQSYCSSYKVKGTVKVLFLMSVACSEGNFSPSVPISFCSCGNHLHNFI